jgi:ABC-type transport system involved in multi-copper enzyme maturation permease subunit
MSDVWSRPEEASIGPKLSAAGALARLTAWRQLVSRQSVVALALTGLCLVIVLAWAQQRYPSTKKFAEQLLIPTYVAFLMPILAVGYGAAAIGGEREDRTLQFLLVTPLPRLAIYLVKLGVTLVIVLGATASSLGVLCWFGGYHGHEAWPYFWSASLWGAATYTALFVLLGAAFRHGTIISLAYWFFLEVMFSNLPGVINRVSIAYYVRCLVYDAGAELRLGPLARHAEKLFEPVSGDVARSTLSAFVITLVVLGSWIFSQREYRDLQ